MAVMESVAARQRGGFDFGAHYDGMCALNNTYPVQSVKAHLQQRILDINADRIRFTDWVPILGTLRINRTLEYVAIRSTYQYIADDKDAKGLNTKRRIPSIRSKEVTHRLSRSLRDCLTVNFVLKCIELQGVPLREKDASALAKGLTTSHSLSHISFEYSILGDEVVNILCGAIKNTLSITSVNLSSCGLSWRSAEILAEVVRHQAMLRHNEAWQDSLRYRKPDLDRMAGIRRITLNCNPMIGDKGAQLLADALKDDLWVKAVDLQQSGITDVGGKALLEILKFNTTIVVMDVRQNPLIPEDVVGSIMDQVVINSGGLETEYQWIKARPIQDLVAARAKQQRKKLRGGGGGGGQGNGFSSRKSSAVRVGGSARKRARPVTTGSSGGGRDAVRLGHGMPWRTALRAQHHKGHPSDVDQEQGWTSAGESHSDVSSPVTTPYKPSYPLSAEKQRHVSPVTASNRAREPLTSRAREPAVNGALFAPRLHDHDDTRPPVMEPLFRRRQDGGVDVRMDADERISKLTAENSRLKEELHALQAKRSILDDESILDSIEQSFQQFHAFLDLLKDAGLGQLIAMAGLDTTGMPFPKGSPMPLANGKSRLDTTIQMRSFLENSRVDMSMNDLEQSFRPDMDRTSRRHPPADRGHSGERSGVRSNSNHQASRASADDYERYERSAMKSPGERYDELYQRVIRDTENVLRVSDDGQGRDRAQPGRHGMGRASDMDPMARSRREYANKDQPSNLPQRDLQLSDRSVNENRSQNDQSDRTLRYDQSQNNPQLSDRSQKDHSHASDRSQRDQARLRSDKLQKSNSQDKSDGSDPASARFAKTSEQIPASTQSSRASAGGESRDNKRRKGSSDPDDILSDKSNSHRSAGSKSLGRQEEIRNPNFWENAVPAKSVAGGIPQSSAGIAPQSSAGSAPQGTAVTGLQSIPSSASQGGAGVALQDETDDAPQNTKPSSRASPIEPGNFTAIGGRDGDQRSAHETRSALQDGRQSRSISEIIEASGVQTAGNETDDQEDDDFEMDHMLSGGSVSDGSIEVLGDENVRGGGDGGF